MTNHIETDILFYEFRKAIHNKMYSNLEDVHTITTDPMTFAKFIKDDITKNRAVFHQGQLRARIVTIADPYNVNVYGYNIANVLFPLQMVLGRYQALRQKDFYAHYSVTEMMEKYQFHGGSVPTFKKKIKDFQMQQFISVRETWKDNRQRLVIPELHFCLKSCTENCLAYLFRMNSYDTSTANEQKKFWTNTLEYSEDIFEEVLDATDHMSMANLKKNASGFVTFFKEWQKNNVAFVDKKPLKESK